ncbi:MAG TPA: bifunctional phosphopantothenoylcysteine decarboxylase/phosphopantothenate--cysteine ligase CoaBC [Nitrosomonas sp.]|jgi:phosphopantothenoylcysteine decarboxylase/phosphopantothenate--cysteine ligase|nr:bifunctional phosphopantothenoylcysteine decarboxylase/phosphopantothenate--cysteine ligase CoaBC [Nitrosomonas sp.]MBP6355106.1 bifunctional phosphopantothenoylcysteine decarboxylase/phosphopantothenate--cysteine ligase CoaBC [Nitrosomonas sp.]MBP9102026.1 bifunctional phosphopantothenoylcysteine decarboxylase/phosphopantothenate--cysteine ligase CoaBC [Nitrosomonas sp.]MBP9871755.1 bifunctional phosphopantothenoylcysteine decarboxylase/phosphopantothenate--cysteine ligase CoaBC [Nitrosomona
MTTCAASVTKRRLLLGVTGGIAAYKAAELARLLTQAGMDVQSVMTQSACQFVGPITFQSLTGNSVYTDLWEANAINNMAHINLSRNVDAILVAPASADFMAKLAHGMADDLLTTLCLARDCPLMLAPAMNRQMWENPATQRNLSILRQDGVNIIGPASGEQACGEVGMGRMLEACELMEAVQAFFQGGILQGQTVLVTAGPTFEAIDAVRGITNSSSGKMGYAIAQAAVEAGAQVILVSGPTCLTPPAVDKFIRVVSAVDMLNAVQAEIAHTDIFISVAAVADYRVANISQQKLKKSDQNLSLELIPNQDILMTVSNLPTPPFCVGFAAETEHLEKNAEAKRRKKKLPLLVANWAQDAIGSDESELILLDDTGRHFLPKASKTEQARHLIKHISVLINPK